MASRAKDTPHFPVHYQDRGCDVSESCLTCPLSQCKHDDPGAYVKYQRRLRDQRICKAVAVEGLTVDEAAQRFFGDGPHHLPGYPEGQGGQRVTISTPLRHTTRLESTGEVVEMLHAVACPTKNSGSFIHCPYCGGCQAASPRCLYCGGEFLASWLTPKRPDSSSQSNSLEAN